MTEPFYADGRVTLFHGDALELARDLPDESIACIVTSPPYFGLRDYGVAGQYGAEPTVDEYVSRLVALFRELRRALEPDGTVWLNLGDSYASRWSSVRGRSGPGQDDDDRSRRPTPAGFTDKQLMLVPARVAIALQADGWTVRSEIVWHKPNPMPESVDDRPTKSHEMIYLLSKSGRYYYDGAAIREPDVGSDNRRRNVLAGQPSLEPSGGIRPPHRGLRTADSRNGLGRNARDVWSIHTVQFPAAHFAVFPPELPRRCIRAGARPAGKRCDCDEVIETPTGTERTDDPTMLVGRAGAARPRAADAGTRPITRRQQRADAALLRGYAATNYPIQPGDPSARFTLDPHWLRTDRIGARPVPPEIRAEMVERGMLANLDTPCPHESATAGIVLDPFSGSGTTGAVALMEGHPFIGFELNREYLELSLRTRFAQQPLDLTSADGAP